MSLYSEKVARCHHIKVNGTQCGSPALREELYCYFHMRWHATRMSVLLKEKEKWIAGLPTMEDANSIQVGLAEVMRLLVTQEVDSKTGALLLYAMQTGSANLKRTLFEPDPRMVVIDPDCVGRRPLGATAWSAVEGREYDEVQEADLGEEVSEKHLADVEEEERGRRCMAALMHLTEGLKVDPKFLDKRASDFRREQEGDPLTVGGAGPTSTEGLSPG